MAEERGQIREGRLERQGTGLVQRGQPRETRIETSSTRGRVPARLLLRSNEWHEEKTNKREDGERSEFTYQQEPTGVELLT
jgi:hypothetical protein